MMKALGSAPRGPPKWGRTPSLWGRGHTQKGSCGKIHASLTSLKESKSEKRDYLLLEKEEVENPHYLTCSNKQV
jgi:hypothetical protein